MLDEKKIYEIYELYNTDFIKCMNEMNQRNANIAWIIIESFKELEKNDKDFSIIIRHSKAQFGKNDFRILDKTIIAFTNSNVNNVVQGITYLSTNLLGFVIRKRSDKTFEVFVAFNGNIKTSIFVEME